MGVPPNHPKLDHVSIEAYGDLGIPHDLSYIILKYMEYGFFINILNIYIYTVYDAYICIYIHRYQYRYV